jgi:asparagine synthase (glutamine-hydrolysing)
LTALDSIELASGMLFGDAPGTAPVLPAPRPGETAFSALEDACLPHLREGRCFVSFSGGRDSSLVLAAAASAARRHGFSLPVPVTIRFPRVGHTDEHEWQELVVRELGIDEWVRLELTDELDVLGDFATRGLRRHGLLWPFNVHFHAPMFDVARGGTLLTGIGGDEALGSSRWARPVSVLRGTQRPSPRDLLRIGLLCAPRPIRRELIVRRAPQPFPWLTERAARALIRTWAADQAREPRSLRARLRRLPGRRAIREGVASLDLLAQDAGTAVDHPLLARSFLGAVAAAGRGAGWLDRSLAMRALFDGVLPTPLLERTSKARFDGVFWGPRSRIFAAGRQGGPPDTQVVDQSALERAWAQSEPDAHSFLLLQAAWLHTEKSSLLDQRSVHNVSVHA